MTIHVFTANKKLRLEADAKTAKLIEIKALEDLKTHSPTLGNLSYLDITGLSGADLKKAFAALRKIGQGEAWGVLDPKGQCPDPAACFFEGAADYLGPSLLKAGLSLARVKKVLAFSGKIIEESPAAQAFAPQDYPFPGWKGVKRGSSYHFYFLYFAVEGQTALKGKLGEANYVTFRERLRSFLQQTLQEADAMLWMETDSSGLFLLPPQRKGAQAAVLALLKAELNAPLIGYEKMGLTLPINFVFALHLGESQFEAPGKTGTVVSEDVNFIFHLGAKRAESGRITLSTEAKAALPEKVADLFIPTASYEGHSLLQSRKF
jgi:hypothetical protein